MILNSIVLVITLINPDSLFIQYSKIAEKNVTTLLGPGDLKKIDTKSDKEFYLFESGNSNNGSIVVFSSAKGRFEKFDYMVMLNKSHEIIDIKILKYRSEYGYEISNKGWLKQFHGREPGHIEYRKDIDAVSGASFSAQSLVNDINSIPEHLK